MKKQGKQFWEIEEYKYGSYHSKRKRKNLHYTIVYSLISVILLITALGLTLTPIPPIPSYSIYALLAGLVSYVCVVYWVLKEWRGKA